MAGEVTEDFEFSVKLGPDLDTTEARDAALDERLPQEGHGVIRSQEGLPDELLLVTEKPEAESVVAGGNEAYDDGTSAGGIVWQMSFVKGENF